MELIAMIAVVLLFGVWAILPSLKALKRKPERKAPAKRPGVAFITTDGSVMHNGRLISLTEARKKGLTLEFERERKTERRPAAWR